MRFALRNPCEGEFRIVHDVTIQSWSPSGVWVTSPTPLRDDDQLRLDIGAGVDDAHDVYAAASVPVVHEGEMRHHVRLDPASAIDDRNGPPAVGRHAFLWQRTTVRLLDLSRSGCCLETRAPVKAGSAGRLEVDLEGQRVLDDIRVAWCRAVEGAGVFHIGVELFPTLRNVARGASLRDLIPPSDHPSMPGTIPTSEESTSSGRLSAPAAAAPPSNTRPDASEPADQEKDDAGNGVAE